MANERGLGRTMTAVGLACVIGTAALIRELASLLPEMPTDWWQAPGAVAQPPGHFDLRAMVVDLSGLAWVGSWLYALSLVWLGAIAWRVYRRKARLLARDRVLVAVQIMLVITVQALTGLTPLKYPWFHGAPF